LRSIGEALGNEGDATDEQVAAAVRAGFDTLQRLGKAEPGDKTMVDAFWPFVQSLTDGVAAGQQLADAWAEAATAAEVAARATADLRPRLGRARPLAERSVGTPDPGATSLAMCARAAVPALHARS
jgi:dihydroxyacetone kinase